MKLRTGDYFLIWSSFTYLTVILSDGCSKKNDSRFTVSDIRDKPHYRHGIAIAVVYPLCMVHACCWCYSVKLFRDLLYHNVCYPKLQNRRACIVHEKNIKINNILIKMIAYNYIVQRNIIKTSNLPNWNLKNCELIRAYIQYMLFFITGCDK